MQILKQPPLALKQLILVVIDAAWPLFAIDHEVRTNKLARLLAWSAILIALLKIVVRSRWVINIFAKTSTQNGWLVVVMNFFRKDTVYHCNI